MVSKIAVAYGSEDGMSPALDRFTISLGAYEASTGTTINAGLNDFDLKAKLNLQHDLGFPSYQTVARARVDFLLGKSQGFSFDYYRINQSHTRSLNSAIGRYSSKAVAFVTGRGNFDFGSVAYKWWFGRGNDVFGVGMGAAYYRVYASATVYAALGDKASAYISGSTANSAWAPQIQLGWRHAFNDSLRMYVNASGVKKNGNHLGGYIYDAALGLEWYPWKNLGFGAEYDYTRIKIHQRRRTYNNALAMQLDGPSVFLRMRF